MLRACLAASFVVLAACTSSTGTSGRAPHTGGPGSATEAPRIRTLLASGDPLPQGCADRHSTATQTVAFVAEGRAWALDPSSGALTCLFKVSAPGPFAWGPLGDRVLLDGLHMEALGGKTLRPAIDVQTGPAAWGHPIGTAVVFVSGDGTELDKRYLDQEGIDDISPLRGATYVNVVYHPSGLALAFVAERNGRQSIWLSSNLGEDPRRLVFTKEGTRFGALEFSPDGRTLVYAAQHADGHPELHTLDLTDPTAIPVIWEGDTGQHVLSMFHPPTTSARSVGLTLGTSCDDSQAVVRRSARQAIPILPDESRPTRVVGWLDRTRILVAAGGCEEPAELSAFDAHTGALVPLVSGVVAAASRAPAPPAPTSLPQEVEAEVGSGVG